MNCCLFLKTNVPSSTCFGLCLQREKISVYKLICDCWNVPMLIMAVEKCSCCPGQLSRFFGFFFFCFLGIMLVGRLSLHFGSFKCLTCSYRMVLINSEIIRIQLISLCTAVQILSNSTSVTLVFVLKVLLVFPLQHLLHFHWIYFKLAGNCGKSRVVSRNCQHGV